MPEKLSAESSRANAQPSVRRLPHVNFRPLLVCALGLVFGIFLYSRIRFGGLRASDFLFVGIFLLFLVRPVSRKRILSILLCFLIPAAVGVAAIHLRAELYDSGMPEGEYTVTGTVSSFSVGNGVSSVVLSELSFDGVRTGGKMQASFYDETLRAGDIVTFAAKVSRSELPENGDSYAEYLFAENLRYSVSSATCERTGKSFNVFLLLNSAVYDVLYENLEPNEADVAYALLTGNSGGMDGTLKTAIREGGVAHIFAVSGLHIGILFGAVSLVFSPLLKRKAFLPAVALSVCYAATCGFAVSSVRAVLMCTALSVNRAMGRKTDFLNSISLAAILILLFQPAEWLSAGFRLSFGACIGLALFSGSFTRLFRRLPSFLGKYLAANLSVQIVTVPVLLDCFGYLSVWGTVLNFFLLPLLPVLFLGLTLCTLFALIVPPAAAVFLFFPESMIALFLYVFSVADFSLVLTGFALGTGAVVWLVGTLLLTQRFRMRALLRGVTAGVLCLLFSLCLISENAVFTGCKIVAYEYGKGACALVRTGDTAVLVIDGDITLSRCTNFLNRTYGGKLDGVVVLAADEMNGINVGAFLPAQTVFAREEIPTGLQRTELVFAKTFTVGGMTFRYEGAEKLVVFAEGAAVEFDFENSARLGADLFVGKGSGGLKFFLKDGIIRAV